MLSMAAALPYSDEQRGDAMVNLVCLVLGHKRTLLAFSSQRFYCGRCGLDLGVVLPAPTAPEARSATTLQHRRPGRRMRRDARRDNSFL